MEGIEEGFRWKTVGDNYKGIRETQEETPKGGSNKEI